MNWVSESVTDLPRVCFTRALDSKPIKLVTSSYNSVAVSHQQKVLSLYANNASGIS